MRSRLSQRQTRRQRVLIQFFNPLLFVSYGNRADRFQKILANHKTTVRALDD
jgi:hypothetical protein